MCSYIGAKRPLVSCTETCVAVRVLIVLLLLPMRLKKKCSKASNAFACIVDSAAVAVSYASAARCAGRPVELRFVGFVPFVAKLPDLPDLPVNPSRWADPPR